MAVIRVAAKGEDDRQLSFRVTVGEGGGERHHDVTVSRVDYLRLGAPYDTPERFIRACFEFLLAREPQESILASFDVSVIGRFFPDFERDIMTPKA